MANRPRNNAVDWLTDRALRGLIASAMALPYEARLRLMGRAMVAIGGPTGYSARARTHLRYVWPDITPERSAALAGAALNNAGRTLIENYSNKELAHRLQNSPTIGDLGPIEAAKAAGQPVIFVSGHFGNYEAPRHALTARGFEIGGIYRAMSNPYFNTHYARTMQEVSGPVFEKGRRGTMGFVKHLRSGGMATILIDVYENGGTPVPFMGHPAPTTTSPAALALKYGALMVPYFGLRKPDGVGFDIHIEPPIAPASPAEMMADATARLEARVRANPGQWFWVHRRWKPERAQIAS